MTTQVNSRDVAVLIPLYKNELTTSEKFSIENTISVLSDRDIFFIAPRKLAGWLQEQVTKYEKSIRVVFFDDKFFASIAGYNKLMCSVQFYRSFENYAYILIVQTDALVFSDRLNEWVAKPYSYVGAPWFYSFGKHEKPLRFLGVGNGGLSFRRVADFLRVLSQPRRIPNLIPAMLGKPAASRWTSKFYHHFLKAYNFDPLMPRINEDVFWGILVPHACSFFLVPTAEDALEFAFETEPRFLYELTGHQLPFGCHAWEKYDYPFWKACLSGRLPKPLP